MKTKDKKIKIFSVIIQSKDKSTISDDPIWKKILEKKRNDMIKLG